MRQVLFGIYCSIFLIVKWMEHSPRLQIGLQRLGIAIQRRRIGKSVIGLNNRYGILVVNTVLSNFGHVRLFSLYHTHTLSLVYSPQINVWSDSSINSSINITSSCNNWLPFWKHTGLHTYYELIAVWGSNFMLLWEGTYQPISLILIPWKILVFRWSALFLKGKTLCESYLNHCLIITFTIISWKEGISIRWHTGSSRCLAWENGYNTNDWCLFTS